ncbi:MAG: biotin transporter BioY [Ruminococcus sp.]|nr:biotin transporter BioY [Ruminococcus sp.]
MKSTSIQNITKIAMFAAIIAVCSLISIPLPSGIPVTLQTFAIALAGFSLGLKNGTISVAVYLAIGAVGVPVFSGLTGGFAKLFGVTGGYLWGFLGMAALCGLAVNKNKILTVVLSVLGLALCHGFGSLQFAFISGSSPLQSFMIASAPYLIKDIVSMAFAYTIALAIQKALSLRRA